MCYMQKIKAIGQGEAWQKNQGTQHIKLCHISSYSSSIIHISKTRGPKITKPMPKIPEMSQDSTPKISFTLDYVW